jgi:hypothetical protein
MPNLTLALTGDNHVDAAIPPAKPGSSLQIDYTGDEDSVPAVFIALIEVDEAEGLGQRKRSAPKNVRPKGDLIAEFSCKIEGGKLALVNPTPKAPTLPATAPTITVELAGSKFDLKLPGVDQENGLFEIRVAAATKASSSTPEYVSDWLAFARHFTAFPRPPGITGAVVAFITGMDEKSFFEAAKEYWKFHADAVFAQDGLSLEEIVTFLSDHADEFGGYGEVNIVTHGNRISAIMRLIKGGERELRISRIEEAFANPDIAKRFADAGAMGLTEDSRVVFRACNIGVRADLLQTIRDKVFNGAAPVFAPKFVQAYDANGPKPIEFFVEELGFFEPRSSQLPPDQEEARVRTLFGAAHPSLSFDGEKATFPVKLKKLKTLNDSFPMTVSEDRFVDFSTGTRRSDASIEKLSAGEFDRISAADDSRDFTKFDQWLSGGRKNEKRADSADDGVWVEPSGTGHKPIGSFAPAGQSLSLGSSADFGESDASDTAPASIRLAGKDVAPDHVTISYGGSLAVTIAGQPKDGGGTNVFKAGGKTVESFSGSIPLSIGVGSATVKLRRFQDISFTVPVTRFFTGWRRTLRIDSSDPSYDKRTIVVPVVTNSAHFGSSNEPTPTRAQLEKLSK